MMQSLSIWEQVVLVYLGVFFLLGIGLAIGNQVYFDQVYTVEDGFLEWMTAIALAHTAFICWQRAWQLRHEATPRVLMMVWMAGVAFTFGCGEEISWGQRLLNISSNAFFSTHNLQQETNFHNLSLGEFKVNKVIFGKGVALFFILYLLVLTPLYVRKEGVKARVDGWGIPIPKRYQVVAFGVIVLGVEGVLNYASETGRRGELTEFAAAFVVMLVVVFPRNPWVFKPAAHMSPSDR